MSKVKPSWILSFVFLLLPPLVMCAYYTATQFPAHQSQAGVHVPEPVWDFGVRNSGPTYRHTFNVVNHTGQELRFLNATSSCGCAVAELPEGPILPRETGAIEVKLNSDNRSGDYRGSVVVTTDYMASPQIEFAIVGKLRHTGANITAVPAKIVAEVIVGGGGIRKKVLLQREGGDPLGFDTASSSLAGVSIGAPSVAEYSQRDSIRHGELDILISDEIAIGQYPGIITVKTSSQVVPSKEIPITINVVPEVEVYPPEIVLQPSADGHGRASLRLRSRLKRPLSIASVRPPATIVGTVNHQQINKHTVEIWLELGDNGSANSILRDSMTIVLKDRTDDKIQIPVCILY